jgi:hypothetical protein
MFGNACVQAASISMLVLMWSKEWRYINEELQRRADQFEQT